MGSMKEIPGWEGFYAATDEGDIISLARAIYPKKGRAYWIPRRVLKQTPGTYGHRYVQLIRTSEKAIPSLVHALVALTFIGPRPPGLEIRHLDGDPGNNRVSNLCYGTSTENNADRLRHGRSNRGNECGSHILQASQIPEIRRLCRDKTMSQTKIAALYGVSRSSILCVHLRKSWSWIPEESSNG